jgi:hypothetical protein
MRNNDQILLEKMYSDISRRETNYGFTLTWNVLKTEYGFIITYKTDPTVKYIVTPYQNGWKFEGNDIVLYLTKKTDGKFHRLDGPAIIKPNHIEFYINGQHFSESEYWKQPEVLLQKKVKPEDRQNASDLLDI